jgi:hydroxymethylpyrimidine/phosphomethylpyrimidine kinase
MTDARTPDPTDRPVVLTIAGSDSGGGAGIQADLKTIEAVGGFGVSAITAATAQNTLGVESTHVLPTDEIEAQIDAVRSDFDVRAVKTGMLATAEIVEAVAATAADMSCPVVVDPVMVAASGDRLLTEAAESAYEGLIAEATLVTPNADETAVLTGIEPAGEDDARTAGGRLLEMGADAALIKGGHMPGSEVLDALVTPEGTETMCHPRIDTDATHGSGCTLSAAIAARLAQGDHLERAVDDSVAFMQRALRYHHAAGEGPGAVHHLVGIRNAAARSGTAEMARSAIDRLCGRAASLVPETGGNVAVSTPYAETVADVATVDGGIERTDGGLTAGGRVRFGLSNRVTEALLDARETDPAVRAGLSVSPSAAVEPDEASITAIEDGVDGETIVLGHGVDAVLSAVGSGTAPEP